ncbi:hypothetical protein [Paludifilum halophilum]|nr:hypothetical protein [Paludifilum halophilum]
MRKTGWILFLASFLFLAACQSNSAVQGDSKSNDSKDISFTAIEKADDFPLPKKAAKNPKQSREGRVYIMPSPPQEVKEAYILKLVEEGWAVYSGISPKAIHVYKDQANYDLFLTPVEKEKTKITLRPAETSLLDKLKKEDPEEEKLSQPE